MAEGTGQNIDLEKEVSLFTETASSVKLFRQAKHARRAQGIEEPLSSEDQVMMDLSIRILKAMIERITGKKINISSVETLKSKSEVPVVENIEGEQMKWTPSQGQ